MNLLKEKNDIKGKVILFHFSNIEEMEQLELEIRKQIGDKAILLERRHCKLSVIKKMLEEGLQFFILEDGDDIEYALLKKIAKDRDVTFII